MLTTTRRTLLGLLAAVAAMRPRRAPAFEKPVPPPPRFTHPDGGPYWPWHGKWCRKVPLEVIVNSLSPELTAPTPFTVAWEKRGYFRFYLPCGTYHGFAAPAGRVDPASGCVLLVPTDDAAWRDTDRWIPTRRDRRDLLISNLFKHRA